MITAEEIEKTLKGMTSKNLMLHLLASPGQVVSYQMANNILSFDPKTAEVLEKLVSCGVCQCTTNRWWPSQYRDLRAALAADEFADIAKAVTPVNTGAAIRLTDAKSGNVVFVAIAAPTADAIRAAAKDAKKEMAARKKETARRIAAERSVDSE